MKIEYLKEWCYNDNIDLKDGLIYDVLIIFNC